MTTAASRPEGFAARHIGPSHDDRAKMLAAVGYGSLADLVDAALPSSIRIGHALDLPPAAGEAEVLAELRALAGSNRVQTQMIGLGWHDTITPPVLRRAILENPAWYTAYTEQLQLSRERIVVAREEERRRLRRDLHDGLGPLLTGVALSADTAANLAERSPQQSRTVLGAVRADTRTAIAEVRRIVEDLRPPVLDELGLLEALHLRAARADRRSDGAALTAVVRAPPALPVLPAAVEVAAYRIVAEALTNAVRHSSATSVVVLLECDEELRVDVSDDGRPDGPWRPGVGITGMRERVAELGGRCEIGPGPGGGRVRVALPLAVP